MIWRGTELFQRALADGCDLRAGQLFDRLAFGWLVYGATTMERVGWGEARTMPAAQAAAEIAPSTGCVETRGRARRSARLPED